MTRGTALFTVVSGVSWEALTLSSDVVTAGRPTTGGTGQSTLLPIHPLPALGRTVGAPVPRVAHTRSALPQTGGTVGAVLHTALVTAAAPQSISTGLTAAGPGPPWQTVALPGAGLAPVSLETVTPLQATRTKCAHLTWLVTVRPLPAGAACTGAICRVTFGPVGTQTGPVTSGAPSPLRTGQRALLSPPTCTHTHTHTTEHILATILINKHYTGHTGAEVGNVANSFTQVRV